MAGTRRLRLSALLGSALFVPSVAALCQDAPFRRGDADTDGVVNIVDGVATLDALFLGHAPFRCADADFDGDADLDAVVGHVQWGALPAVRPFSVLLGNGDGTFAPFEGYGDVSRTDRVESLVVDDFDGDGDLDVVGANGIGDGLPVLWSAGDGTFIPGRVPLPAWTTSVVSGDLDGNGRPDLVAVVGDGRSQVRGTAMWILRNLGGGAFAEPERIHPGGKILAVARPVRRHRRVQRVRRREVRATRVHGVGRLVRGRLRGGRL